MAQSHTFKRQTADDLIVIVAQIGQSLVDLVLDTGASHTFIDFGILIKEGYRLSDSQGLVPVETANGIIYANVFSVPVISSLGILKSDFEITSYLFDDLQNDFKGVLGLDFFDNTEFCISLKVNTLTIKM
jgi:hypothetical protein